LQYISAIVLPAPPPEEVPAPPTPTEAVAPHKVIAAEPAPEHPPLVAVREFENSVVPIPSATEIRPIESAVLPTPPAPEPPKPVVGAFANTASIPRTPEPAGRVESAGFNAQVADARQSKLGAASVGAFDTVTQQAAAPPTQQSRVIREGGFGSSSNAERPKTHHSPEVRTAGFGDAKVVEPMRKTEVAPQRPAVIPVEVLAKPTPSYTDEARRLKIEGEVVLEVEFLAGGSVRVVRVVRGLGYGLDESATSAAQRIQFKPATSEGRPVDFRTTVQIVFRLA
jgi:TonB family protein